MGQLYIRTQDRDKLCLIGEEFPEITYFPWRKYEKNGHLLCFFKGGKVWTLGKYESRERCLEVLDDIERFILDSGTEPCIVYHMPEK
jgi:hypothetical protein